MLTVPRMGAARSSGLGSNARRMRSRRWPQLRAVTAARDARGGVLTGYPRGTHGVLTGYSQLRAVTAERDAFAKAHAQCEALYAALAAQHGLKANAHGAAQPLLEGR